MSVEDPVLVARIQVADPDTLEEVVRTYLSQMLRAARGAGLKPHEAEEVVQTTFAVFIEKADRFEGRSRVRTWLFGILYRKISEARRRLGRSRQMDSIDDFEERFDASGSWSSPPQSLEMKVYSRQVRGLIENCIEEVPLKQRMAFLLREVEELDGDEICNILDVSRTNLGVLFYRVRNRLRECLEAHGVRREE